MGLRTPFLIMLCLMTVSGHGSDRELERLIEQLSEDRTYGDHIIMDIAAFGHGGRVAAPMLLRILEQGKWDERVAAATALGRLGYREAIPALSTTLKNPDDSQLVAAAARSLGWLGAEEALDQLRGIAKDHWFEPVRRVATESIDYIQTGEIPTGLMWDEWHHWLAFWRNGNESCKPPTEFDRSEGGRRIDRTNQVALEELTYGRVVEMSRDPLRSDAPKDIQTTIDGHRYVMYTTRVDQVPSVGVRVQDGWLVGSYRGEFIGELVHVEDSGKESFLYKGNIRNIHHLGDRLVATTGIAHRFSNRGTLLTIERSEGSGYTARPWKRLPAAPRASWLNATGELFINIRRVGTVLVDRQGRMEHLKCPPSGAW